MIAFSFILNLWQGKKIYMESVLICLIHSPGNSLCDLLIEDVCIWLMVSFNSAAPYPGSLHILAVCSKALLWEYLHCLCLQNRKKRRGGKNEFKVVALLSHFSPPPPAVDPSE